MGVAGGPSGPALAAALVKLRAPCVMYLPGCLMEIGRTPELLGWPAALAGWGEPGPAPRGRGRLAVLPGEDLSDVSDLVGASPSVDSR